jgi:hypothetical protein
VWRKNIFDIYVTEYGTALTTILPILFLYLNLTYIQSSIVIYTNEGNNKITELRTILQRESPNS